MHPSGFYFDAKVGGQNLKLQLDASYSSIIVPQKHCNGCRLGDRRYDPTKSASSHLISCADRRCERNKCSRGCHKCSDHGACCAAGGNACAFNMIYGGGSTGNGSLYHDTLEIAGLKAKVLFGAMQSETRNFEHAYVDGVFGVAFEKGACHPGCIPPAMDYVVNQTGIDNKLTFCGSRFGGTLTLGEADTALATEPYRYVKVTDTARKKRFIVRAASHWKINGSIVSLPGITQAMVATTTSSLAIGSDTMRALQDHFMMNYCEVPQLCSLETWFKPHRCVHLEDKYLAMLPNITIPLHSGVALTITPDDYLIKYREIQGKMFRCVGFHISNRLALHGIGLVIGANVMQRYAVVFDREARRVGFAPARDGKCGPKTGSTLGLAGLSGGVVGGDIPMLTATSPVSSLSPGIEPDTPIGKKLLHAELCRAKRSCSACARTEGCSFWYQTGKCLTRRNAKSSMYPYCSGMFCACWLVGQSGWYFGITLGILIAVSLLGGCTICYRKRQRNRYAALEGFDEQDIETF